MIDDLVESLNNQMSSNVRKCLIAKQRMICRMIDDGYHIEVPAEDRWHPSKRNDRNFVNSLNTSSIYMLN